MNFQYTTQGYIRGYRYIIKEKPSECVVHSPDHPDLTSAWSRRSTKGLICNFLTERRRLSTQLEKATQAPPPVTPLPTNPNAARPHQET